MTDPELTKEIQKGWADFCETYSPRELTPLEKLECERTAAMERIAQKTPFVLGEPLG